ncbi:MAG: hypothetical protein U0802_09535 [Candidatus Binatia bacterium]
MRLRTVVPHAAATALFGVALATLSPVTGEAHKAITSKFTYNDDLFPLFRDKCGACHVDGGVAPMSLLSHEDASPWGESLRLELLGEEAPKPWHVGAYTLTAREFDMILVWANGGTPRGDAAKAPPVMTVKTAWVAGPPDAALKMPAPFTLPGPSNEATHDVVLPVGAAAGKSLRAVDLLPGQPAIVRMATLSLKGADGVVQPLGTWIPGQAHAIALKTPIVVPASASIVATIEYRRTWKYEGQDLADASTIGLYFGSAAAPRTTRPGAR